MCKFLKLSYCITLILLLTGCISTGIQQAKVSNSETTVTYESSEKEIYKIDSLSKKTGTVFIRKFVNGLPTDLDLFKITKDTYLTSYDYLKEFMPNEVVFFESAIINDERVAVKFGRKNAKLEEGIKRITIPELETLLASDRDFTLIDARPKGAYDFTHIPGAISIPVELLKKQDITLLPEDKNRTLVFYCGGFS